MNVLNINSECDTAEISLTIEELVVIFKAFANIDIGIIVNEYEKVFNVDKTFIKALMKDFDCFWDLLNMKNNKVSHFILNKYDNKRNLVFIEVGVLEIKSMRFALSTIPANVYEEDCSIMLGNSWEEFQDVKYKILMLIRELRVINDNIGDAGVIVTKLFKTKEAQ